MGMRRGHVPYRNSTLTSVLRDRCARVTWRSGVARHAPAHPTLCIRCECATISRARSLGGNCRTAMIATVQPVATQARRSSAWRAARSAPRAAHLAPAVAPLR